MKLASFWKLKRELSRVVRKIKNSPKQLVWYLFSTKFYEIWMSKGRKVWGGEIPFSDRVVVYVIYPSDGLLESHLVTLRHIQKNGYTTVVVSNQPLTDTDRARLLSECSRYIERPNFGYDFGAYRDGVLSIQNKFSQLVRIVLLNDSTWFPLPGTQEWLKEAESMNLDFVGAVSNFGTPRLPPNEFLNLDWNYCTSHANFHYCSFALSIGPKIITDPKFLQFWANFRLDNDKARVVRRGEIGLTKWVIRHEFTHDCTCNPSSLKAELEKLSDDRLFEVASRLIIPERKRAQKAKDENITLSRQDPAWRFTMTQLILWSVSQQGTGYVLPELTTKEMKFPFLKKSPLRLSKAGSDISLEIIAEIPGQIGQSMLDEANKIARHCAT